MLAAADGKSKRGPQKPALVPRRLSRVGGIGGRGDTGFVASAGAERLQGMSVCALRCEKGAGGAELRPPST